MSLNNNKSKAESSICYSICFLYYYSMAVEPLYPLVCARNASTLNQCRDDPLSPMAVAASLISLPCPLVFKYKDNIGVIQLITEVRMADVIFRCQSVGEGGDDPLEMSIPVVF